jgi:hypothetical protein
MEEDIMTQRSLKIFVGNGELKGTSPLVIVHNIMEWMKERIKP